MTLKCHLGASGLRFSEKQRKPELPRHLLVRFTWISWVRPFGSGTQAPLCRWYALHFRSWSWLRHATPKSEIGRRLGLRLIFIDHCNKFPHPESVAKPVREWEQL